MPVSVQTVSRRDFVRWSLALGAAVAMPRTLLAGPSPAVDYFALLSDAHVSGGIQWWMGNRLSVAAKQVLDLPQPPQRVLVAGDCAYLTGEDRDYREYIRRIQPLMDAGL